MCKLLSINEILENPLFYNLRNPETVTVVYDPNEDNFIINKDNRDHKVINLLMEKYMSSSFAERMEYQEKYPSFTDTMRLLEDVIYERHCRNKNWKYEEKAKPVMEMLLKPNEKYNKIFLENMDLLKAMHRLYRNTDIDNRPDDYNIFMYGYMLGSQAERARRKKVSHV